MIINKGTKTIPQSGSQYKALFYIINLKCNDVYEIERFQFHKCLLPGVLLWICFPTQIGLSISIIMWRRIRHPLLPPVFMKYIKTADKPCLGIAFLLWLSTLALYLNYSIFTAFYLKPYVTVKLFSKLLWKSILNYSSNLVNYKKTQIFFCRHNYELYCPVPEIYAITSNLQCLFWDWAFAMWINLITSSLFTRKWGFIL